MVVPDRQLSLAIGKEGQNARLAAKLTGWRIDIKSETEAATEGLAEIKRQQLQVMKQRSLEQKAAALPGTDDLLSRAEWLLRERDKTAVTLEQAAKMLADAEALKDDTEITELPLEVAAEAAAPVSTAEVAGEPEIAVSAEAAEPVAAASETTEAPVQAMEELAEGDYLPEYEAGDFEEGEEEEGSESAKKPAKRSKKTAKKRELVFDENIGAVVSIKKRKPTRGGGWGDFEDY